MNVISEVLEYCAGLPEWEAGAGEVVLEEGGRSGRLYVLVEGVVEVLKGGLLVARVAHGGAVFGEMSALLDQPHSAEVRCAGPARFVVIDRPLEFMRGCPEVGLAVARLLAERLGAVTRYLVDLKAQYEDRADHLGMVDEVLESLVHHQKRRRGGAGGGGGGTGGTGGR